jgi:hypothetical protein
MKKTLLALAAAALLAPALAAAQTTTTTVVGVPASIQVSRLGPQLVSFAGGQTNFDSLVNGLALGTPVTLTTTLPTGQTQIVTFTPNATMTPVQIAQTLESARQNLIARGIGTPTSQQVAITLTGGLLPTQLGPVQVNAFLPANVVPVAAAPAATTAATTSATGGTVPVAPNVTTTVVQSSNGTPSPAALLQGQSGAGGTTPPSPAAIIQQQRGSNISDTPTTGNISNTPTPATSTTPTTSAPATVAAPLAPTTPVAPNGSPFAPAAR